MENDCIKLVRTCHRCQGQSRQEEHISSAFAFFSSTMALLSLGYGCHRTHDSESIKQSRVHLSGYRLFHKVGGGTLYKSVT